MDTIVPSDIPLGKHYVYTLSYPESMGGRVFYVGKGQGKRIHLHEREARMNKTHNPYKCNVIRKIWREGGQVVKTIIDYFNTHEEASMLEIALIFFLPDLTNLTRGGDGIVELPRSAEHNRKISEALTGKRMSLEVRRKQSEARKRDPRTITHLHKMHEARRGKPAWNSGKPGKPISEEECRRRSETRKGKPTPWLQTTEARRKQAESLKVSPKATEARRKLNEAQKGRKVSEERRMQMSEIWRKDPRNAEHLHRVSEANRGKTRSAETRRKISEIRSGQRMRPLSEEHKRKLSEAGKGRVVSEETRRKISETKKERSDKGMKRATTAHTSIPIIWPLDPQTPLKCEDIDQLSLWNDA